MGFFDSVYDAMTWAEVCSRLPGDMAVSALKRRVTNVDTLKMFFDNVGSQPSSIRPLKEHVNSVMSTITVDDLLKTFDGEYHKTLFNWMDGTNTQRFRADPSKLDLKFLFNVTESKDQVALESIMDKVLADAQVNMAHVRATLSRADDSVVAPLLAKISVDSRPEVRATLLAVPGSNADQVSDMQKIIGLKAVAKCPASPLHAVNMLNLNLFSTLKPAERLVALQRYLDCFPRYRKVQAFNPAPTDEELRILLFAGCIEQNETVTKIMEDYKQITEADRPKGEEEEE